jgi:uncharacterized protein YndB with AHSA1/START domain
MTSNPIPSTYGVAHVELEVKIDSSLERVWKAIVEETSEWWPREFFTSAGTKGFIIEPRLGGRVYEDWGGGAGLLWFTVIGLNPPTTLLLLGHLTPAFGGPAMSVLELALQSVGESVVLRVTETVSGRAEQSMEATLRDGWIAIFDAGLRVFVESRP